MNKNFIAIAALLIIGGVALFQSNWLSRTNDRVDEARLGPVDQPSREWMPRVEPICRAMDGKANAVDLGWFFYHLGDAAETLHSKSELASLNKTIADRLELAAADLNAVEIVDTVDKVLLDSIGSESGPLTDANRLDWKSACQAIAWACFKASGKNPDLAFDLEAYKRVKLVAETLVRPTAGSDQILAESNNQNHGSNREYPGSNPSKLLPIDNATKYTDFVTGCDLLPMSCRSPFANQPVVPVEKKNSRAQSVLFATQSSTENVGPRGPPDWLTHGLTFNENEHQQFLTQTPRFSNVFRGESSAGKTRLLYRAARTFDPEIFDDNPQTTGDCVSRATANACSTVNACQILVDCLPYEWTARCAPEPIYGHRGHGGQGMSVERAAEFVSRYAGVPFRINYGRYDFSRYDARIGTNWGNSGVPADLIRELKLNPMTHAALVTNAKEAQDAIANCFPLVVGSDASFSFSRDQHGFAKRTGPGHNMENPSGWAHAMAWLGVSTAKELAGEDWSLYGQSEDSPCFLIVNSWGSDWINGPRGKFDIPLGSFWITQSDAAYMIQQRQSVAIGAFKGFATDPINSLGFEYLKKAPKSRGVKELAGAIPIAIAIATCRGHDDPTQPNAMPRPMPRPNPKPSPTHCTRCNGTGVVVMADGNQSPCPCKLAEDFDREMTALKQKWETERAELKRKIELHESKPETVENSKPETNSEPPAAPDPPIKTKWMDYGVMYQEMKSSKSGTWYLLVGSDICQPCKTLKAEIQKELDGGREIKIAYREAEKSDAKKMLNGRSIPALIRVVKNDGAYSNTWMDKLPTSD